MISQDQIQSFFDSLHSFSQKDQVVFDFFIWKSKKNQISVADQKLKKNSSSEDQQLNLRLLRGRKSGSSYTKKLSLEGVNECYEQALKSLEISDKEERGDLSEHQNYPDLSQSLCSKSFVDVSDKIKKVKIMDQGALSLGSQIQPVFNVCSDIETFRFFGNSNNNQGSYLERSVFAYSQCLAVDKEKRSQGFFHETGRGYEDINFQNVGQESASRSLKKLNFIIPPTGVYPVIFKSGQAVSTLLFWLADHLNGKTAFEGLSLLKNDFQKKKFASCFSFYDQPLENWGLRAAPFDEEGFCSQNTSLVKDGVLQNYLTDTFLARALNRPHTAKSVRDEWGGMDVGYSNLWMKEGSNSFEDLIQEFPQVIVVDSLKGLAGYNGVSGDFSIESEGFLHNKSGCHAICQFTVSGNLINVFAHILKIANDSEIYNGSVKAPSFLVPELSIAGS